MAQTAHASSAVIDTVDESWAVTDPGPVREETYRLVAMEDPERQWELHDGLLREKPGMGMGHNDVMMYLAIDLAPQLDASKFRLRANSARLRLPSGSYYIPDLVVIPTEYVLKFADRPDDLEYYDGPVPLLGELWSRSTGNYDVNTKLPNYQKRGDLEIWRLQPYEHRLTTWRRQPDGTYQASDHLGGIIQPIGLPGVEIDLDTLFDVRGR
jgi:Uma2 family endonuclease